MKRVIIFRNGSQVDGKVILLSHSIKELLDVASVKFRISGKHVFTAQGGEIDDIKLIRDDDVLYITEDEPFIRVDISNSNIAPSVVLKDPVQKPNSRFDIIYRTPFAAAAAASTVSAPLSATAGSSSAGTSASNFHHNCSVSSQKQAGLPPSKDSLDEEDDVPELAPLAFISLEEEGERRAKLQDWIKLNVGGKYFTTSRSTLAKEPTSMLARMFANNMNPSNVDETGAYLIDRSPTYFEPILNYLRNGQLIFDNNVNPAGVLEEARFFGIESLVAHLENLISNQQRSHDILPLSRRDVINALIITPFTTELRFQGVNLAGSDLSRLDLRHINFKFACLHGCRMVGANLSWCCLERADLSHAVMETAQLVGVKMLCANLEGANLRGCNFEDPGGCRTNMEGVNLKGANLECSNMAGVNLRVATLKNANLQNCDLRAAVLAGADLEKCDLSGSDLHEANLRGANLKDAAFELMLTPLHMAQTIR